MTRLQSLARRPPRRPEARADPGRCELCSAELDEEHRHVVDVHRDAVLCACRGCAVLLDQRAAGGGHFRLVPERSRRVLGLELDEGTWAGLGVPVDVAFFRQSTAAGRPLAVYPSPLGPTEALPDAGTWADLLARSPALAAMAPDVEALLVRRRHGEQDLYVVPIDRCYALVGLVRRHWRGFGGGDEVWRRVDGFFSELAATAQEER
jgi:hypothetical protein